MQNKHKNFEYLWFYLRKKELLREIQHKEITKGIVDRKGPEISNFSVSTFKWLCIWNARQWFCKTLTRVSGKNRSLADAPMQPSEDPSSDTDQSERTSGTKLYLFIRRTVSDNPVQYHIYCYFYTFSIFQHHQIYSTCSEFSYSVPSIGLFHRQNWSFSPKTCQNFAKFEARSTDHEAESGPATSLKSGVRFYSRCRVGVWGGGGCFRSCFSRSSKHRDQNVYVNQNNFRFFAQTRTSNRTVHL